MDDPVHRRAARQLIAPEEARAMLANLDLVPKEDLHWSRVRGLIPADGAGAQSYLQALRYSAPESGSFVLFSLRRRKEQSGRRHRN